jgi:retron-type reverse transcriptase
MAEASSPVDKVRELQRKLWSAAKASGNRRFHVLYDKVYRMDILWEAWSRVRANGGAPGLDGKTIQAIEEHGVEEFLKKIQEDLKAGKYWPTPVRRQYVPKPDGKKRPLGIPTVRDRVVQAAAKIVIEPIFEADFEECSYGFRPGRNAQQALEAIRETANAGFNWVVDADIEKYFDSIDHELLMEAVQKRISDRKMLKLIRKWLKAGVMEDGALRATEVGSPQGSVISPLLSNIYLGELDRRWRSLQRDNKADPLRGRLGGDVSHPEGSPTSTPDGGSDPQRTQAQATSREDADSQSQRGSRGVHVSGMHAQEGAVTQGWTKVLSEPLAEPKEHEAHPGTYPGGLRSPAPWADGLAGSDRTVASGDAGMGRLLPERQCLESLHEDRTSRSASVEPVPSTPQSASARVSDLCRGPSPWTAPSTRHDSIPRRSACTDRIDSR